MKNVNKRMELDKFEFFELISNEKISNDKWTILQDNIEFFKTLYSIHYPFSLDTIQSIIDKIILGNTSNSCFEIEDIFVRDCRSNWGFYFNQKTEWTIELRNYLKEEFFIFSTNEEKFPLSQKAEIEFYFKYNQEKYYAYDQASKMSFVDFEHFINSDGYLDKTNYDEVCVQTELLFQKELSIAELKDAQFKVNLYNFEHFNCELKYFFNTFKSKNDFEIIKFIFDTAFYERINDLVSIQIPNFSIENLFNRK